MGSWRQTGSLKYWIETSGSELKCVNKDNITDTTLYVVHHQYVCKSSEDLRRIIIRMENANSGQELDRFLVQYYFVGSRSCYVDLSHLDGFEMELN